MIKLAILIHTINICASISDSRLVCRYTDSRGEATIPAGRNTPLCSNTSLESLYHCQHSGHRLTGCRVRANDSGNVRASCENGDGVGGSRKRPQERVLEFFVYSLSSLARELSDAKLNDSKNESIFTHFLIPTQT